jgi:two-component system, OmpR family, response regulator ResD
VWTSPDLRGHAYAQHVTSPARVLVVEDDATIAEVVVSYLRQANLLVEAVADGAVAVAMARRFRPRLVVLDLMLPGLNGLDVCRQMRAEDPDIAVVMLTALGEENDRVTGLETGADDYLVKPFSPRELVLRVQSVLRRAQTSITLVGDGVLTSGGVVVDLAARSARVDGRPVVLTGREFDLLTHLVRHPGRVHSREDLMREVWGWEFGDTSTVTVHVRRLREKLEPDPATPTRLVTVWGVGYRWEQVLAESGASGP